MEERDSATFLFFNFWLQYYHSTLSKYTMSVFFTSYCGLLLQKLFSGNLAFREERYSVSQTLLQ